MPFIAGPSSSLVRIIIIDPSKLFFLLTNELTANKNAAMLPFISEVPLPYSLLFSSVNEKGS